MNLMFWKRNADEFPGREGRVLELLSTYLDGEATDAEAAEAEELIARDEDAADLFEDLRMMRTAFGALGEVRAPRSFAIPAEMASAATSAAAMSPAAMSSAAMSVEASAPRTAGGPFALFRRAELFMRASAAVAALLFVVALVNNPGGDTPTAADDSSAGTTALSAPASEALRAEPEAAGAQLESAPAEEPAAGGGAAQAGEAEGYSPDAGDNAGDSAGDSTEDSAGGAAEGETPAVPAPEEGAGEPANTGEAAAGTFSAQDAPATASDGDQSRNAAELQPSPAGTERTDDASQRVGGMVPALGVLAALFTALSVLAAWTRRSGSST